MRTRRSLSAGRLRRGCSPAERMLASRGHLSIEYWDRLFGRGLVASVDDMDRAPWNAELLDTLAEDFVEHGYDIQFLLRRIMTSRAYQAPPVALRAEEKDFVFRGPLLRRLTAEQYVDAISSITRRVAGAGHGQIRYRSV